MKKAKILCALLSILLLFSVLGVLFSNAYTNICTVTVNINLTSDKAEATITAYAGTVIEATLKLYRVVGSNKYLLQTTHTPENKRNGKFNSSDLGYKLSMCACGLKYCVK